MAQEKETAVLHKTYQLVIRQGPEVGKIFPLTSVSHTIGRDPLVEISLNDLEVSRQHARLTETAAGYQLEDLNSTNGTFVDGLQIGNDPILLTPGQEIRLGSDILLAYVEAETETAVSDSPAADLEATMVAAPEPEPQPAREPETKPIGDEEAWEEPPATAVPLTEPPSPPELEPVDPMLPPDFEDIPSLRALHEVPPPPENAEFDLPELPDLPDLPDLPELPDFPELEAEPKAPSQQTTPPRVVPGAESAPPASGGKSTTRRIVTILAAVLLILMCCCCGFLIFMYQWGGDWLLRQMQFVP